MPGPSGGKVRRMVAFFYVGKVRALAKEKRHFLQKMRTVLIFNNRKGCLFGVMRWPFSISF